MSHCHIISKELWLLLWYWSLTTFEKRFFTSFSLNSLSWSSSFKTSEIAFKYFLHPSTFSFTIKSHKCSTYPLPKFYDLFDSNTKVLEMLLIEALEIPSSKQVLTLLWLIFNKYSSSYGCSRTFCSRMKFINRHLW